MMKAALIFAAGVVIGSACLSPGRCLAIESQTSQSSSTDSNSDRQKTYTAIQEDIVALSNLFEESADQKLLSSEQKKILNEEIATLKQKLIAEEVVLANKSKKYSHCYADGSAETGASSADEVSNGSSETTNQGDKSKQNPIFSGAEKFASRFSAGSDGISTLQKDCWGDLAVTTNGATISIQNDGILKKQTETFKGAIGFAFIPGKDDKDTIISRVEIYGRIDNENQITTERVGAGIKKIVTYTEDVLETGIVVRSAIRPPASGLKLYMYSQPFYIKDEARESELYGADFRLVPVRQYINSYNAPRAQYSTDAGLYWGVVTDVRLDAAHFSVVGLPLAAPLKAATPSSTIVGVPLELPNEDYIRAGGRIGFMSEAYPSADFAEIIGKGPFYFHFYYIDFAAIDGVSHGFGEVTGQLTVPIAAGVSFAATYLNGRSENIAAREQSWSLGIKSGSAP